MVKDKLEIKNTTLEYINYLKTRLRNTDKEEISDMFGKYEPNILIHSFEISNKCWTLLKNNEPIYCWGVSDKVLIGSIGMVWLLGTDKIEEVRIKLLKDSKKYIQEMLKEYDFIENYVSVKNKLSILWLKWCGFRFEEPKRMGIKNQYFIRFFKYKEA